MELAKKNGYSEMSEFDFDFIKKLLGPYGYTLVKKVEEEEEMDYISDVNTLTEIIEDVIYGKNQLSSLEFYQRDTIKNLINTCDVLYDANKFSEKEDSKNYLIKLEKIRKYLYKTLI